MRDLRRSASPRRLRPDDVFGSFREVTADYLQRKGIRFLLLDIDNTLAPHGLWSAPPEAVAWVRGLESSGIRCHAVSNGHPQRIASFCRGLAIPFLARAGKPSPRPIRQAMRTLGALPEETAFLGDQLTTDIRGAWNAGLRSILVHPVSLTEPFGLRLRRRFEIRRLRRLLTMAELQRWSGPVGSPPRS